MTPDTPARKFPVLNYRGQVIYSRTWPALSEPARDLPAVAEPDVLVVGGGPAGYSAAIAAARQGARVLLVERYGFLGGLATHGLIRGWFPRYNLYPECMGGIPMELLEHMQALGAAERHGVKWSFNDLILRIVLDEVMEQAGARTLLHTRCVGALMGDGRLRGIVIENKAGRQAVLAKVVVDATGDGDVAASAGAPFDQWEKSYINPLTFCIDIMGVDSSPEAHERTVEILEEAERTGKVDVRFERFAFAAARPGEGMVAHTNVEITCKDGASVWDLTLAEKDGRRKIFDLLAFLKANVPGYADCYLANVPTQVSVETTRRIAGEYVVTADDVVQGRQFPDSVCTGTPKGHFQPYIEKGRRHVWNGIPYRALLPQRVEGLLVAGRCFSSSHEAYRGHPDMPICMAMGQAAGTAAAMAVAASVAPRQVDVPRLRESLRAQCVWIGGDAPSAGAAPAL